MSTESDLPKRLEDLLKNPRTGFAAGYREGALAERARVVSLCARARNSWANSVDDITTLANKVLKAGDAIPPQEDLDGMWTVTRASADLIRVTPQPEYTEGETLKLIRLERKCERQDRVIKDLREELRSRV